MLCLAKKDNKEHRERRQDERETLQIADNRQRPINMSYSGNIMLRLGEKIKMFSYANGSKT